MALPFLLIIKSNLLLTPMPESGTTKDENGVVAIMVESR
jgi:hypothetical protein